MTLLEKINTEMKNAMKTKAEQRLSVMRMLKTKIMLVDSSDKVPDEKVLEIIIKYAKSLKETIAINRQNNQEAAAAEAESELAIVKEFLPPELTEEQIKEIVKKAIADTGAASAADMGKVMKAVMPLVKGADGNIVKNAVLSLLKK